jgi:putative oxidoreductase
MSTAGWIAWAPRLQSLLRIVAAFLFVQFGTMKILAFPIGTPPHGSAVPLASQLGLAGILEITGGTLLLLGLFTRPVAFILSGMMSVAYFQAHAPHGFWPLTNGGVDAVLYCFLWLYFSAAGGGPWSIDALRRRA